MSHYGHRGRCPSRRAVVGIVLPLILFALNAIADPEAPTPSLHPTDWWTAFDHPGMTAAIEQGLAAHPDVASALARVRAAESGVDTARAGRRPEADLRIGARAGREQTIETGGVPDDIDPLFASARLSWELDLLGQTAAEISAASARTEAAEAERAGVRLMLSLAIARTYIDVAEVRETVALLAEERDHQVAILERIQRLQGSGLRSATAVHEAEAALEEARHRWMNEATRLDQLEARLRSLVGGDLSREVEISLLDEWTLPPRPNLKAEEQRIRRPDVVQSWYAWQAARGTARAERRTKWPRLSLVVSAAGEGEDAGDPDMWSAWAGPVISLPVWNPKDRATRRRARAKEQAAEAAFQSVSLRAVEEVDRAWAERSRSEPMIHHMQVRHEALRSVEASERRKFEAGLIDNITCRNARIRASQAARAERRWRAAALQAHLNLIAALGGG